MIRIRYGDDPNFKAGGGVQISAPAASTPAAPGSETKFAGTGADDASVGSDAWNAPGNITSDNLNEAFTGCNGSQSHYLKASNFAFSIPPSATIDGVIVTMERYRGGLSPDGKDVIVRLVKGGVVAGDNKADTATDWPTGAAVTKTYGGAADLWGLALTPADVNAANFGVVLSVEEVDGSGEDFHVDYISITVYYTA